MPIDSIRAHYDLSVFAGLPDGPYDRRSSLGRLADQVRAALASAYPYATICVTWSAHTDDDAQFTVSDGTGDGTDNATTDVVRAVADRVRASSYWMVPRYYRLTPEEAAVYDSGDDSEGSALFADLRARFGGCDVEITHPAGFVVESYVAYGDAL